MTFHWEFNGATFVIMLVMFYAGMLYGRWHQRQFPGKRMGLEIEVRDSGSDTGGKPHG